MKFRKTPMAVLQRTTDIGLIRLIQKHEQKLIDLLEAQKKDLFIKNDLRQYVVKLQKENLQLESKLLFFESELKKLMEE